MTLRFKITSIEVRDLEPSDEDIHAGAPGDVPTAIGPDEFFVEVRFSYPTDDPEHTIFAFGTLGTYHHAHVIHDRKAYEAHYEDKENLGFDFVPTENPNFSTLKWRKPTAFELGFCSFQICAGLDKIRELENGEFAYSEYISKNLITEAAVKQLQQMKSDLDTGKCQFGDYPDQIGAFHSGDPFSDFLRTLETLDKFWT